MTIQHSASSATLIVPIPAFSDNYIWLIHNGREAAVIDPGDAGVVKVALERLNLRLVSILITHHHHDHTGGIELLRTLYSPRVYGPRDENITGLTDTVAEGHIINLDCLNLQLSVLEVPGHTRSHIAYLGQGAIFIGDTLFSGGCGRLLGGSAEQLYTSLQRICSLPGNTKVYCAHEYTLANLRFSRVVEANNPARDAWEQQCLDFRAADIPSVPTTLSRELEINPFLRTWNTDIRHAVSVQCGRPVTDDQTCFTELRKWKDRF